MKHAVAKPVSLIKRGAVNYQPLRRGDDLAYSKLG